MAHCIVRSKNRQKILLVRRTEPSGKEPGLWECPAVQATSGNEDDLRQAIEKNLPKLVGLRRVILRKEEKFLDVTETAHFIIGLDESADPLVLDKDHDCGDWVSYERALEYKLMPTSHLALIALRDRLKTPFG